MQSVVPTVSLSLKPMVIRVFPSTVPKEKAIFATLASIMLMIPVIFLNGQLLRTALYTIIKNNPLFLNRGDSIEEGVGDGDRGFKKTLFGLSS